MKKLLILILTSCFVTSLLGIKTNDPSYNDEYNYNTRMLKEVLPYFKMNVPEEYKKNHLKYFIGTSNGKQKIKIGYDIFGPEDAEYHIVLLHGLGTTFIKYTELMYDMEVQTGNNIRFYVMDNRGFGFSDRFDIRDFEGSYIDKYDNAVNDVKIFMDKIVIPDVKKTSGSKKPVYMLATSMGGGIATRFLQKHHGYFSKVILNSPMLNFKAWGIFDNALLLALSSGYVLAGCGGHYAELLGGQGPKKYKSFEEWGDKNYTNCPERYYFMEKTIFYGSEGKPGLYPENSVGGITWNWFYRSCLLGAAIVSNVYNVDKNADILILQAEDDNSVKTDIQDLFGRLLNNCKVVKFKGLVKGVKSKHALTINIDDIRGDGEEAPNTEKPVKVFDHIFKFFSLKSHDVKSKYI